MALTGTAIRDVGFLQVVLEGFRRNDVNPRRVLDCDPVLVGVVVVRAHPILPHHNACSGSTPTGCSFTVDAQLLATYACDAVTDFARPHRAVGLEANE